MWRRAPLDPPAFFRWLAGRPDRKDLCIECGAGTGEISAFFSTLFRTVLATDILPRVANDTLIVKAAAESIPAADASVDLVFSMQALHHFHVGRHLSEVTRVLRPGGIFAALCWGNIVLPEKVFKSLSPVFEAIEHYWEPERDWVNSGYDGLDFPGRKLSLPEAGMTRTLNASGLKAEISNWSATRRARDSNVTIPDAGRALEELCSRQVFRVYWPITGQAFRIER